MGERVPQLTREEAEALLLREARLLDDRKFEEWLTLFTDDGIYWLPIQEDKGPDEAVSIIYDEPIRRQERVYRLLHTPALAQDPPSRTVHFIANVEVEPGQNGTVSERTVFSNQLVAEVRIGAYRQLGLGEQRLYAARCEHRLRHVDGDWRIALKRVLLVNRDLPLSNITFIF